MESGETFKVRWMRLKGQKVPFLMQNVDGECPFISLCNVLLLNRRLQMPSNCNEIQFSTLSSHICSLLPGFDAEFMTSVLRSLMGGLMVNCWFDSTRTTLQDEVELLFRELKVPVKHCWIADPIIYGVLSNYNYDQLLDKLTLYQSKMADEPVKEDSAPKESEPAPAEEQDGKAQDQEDPVIKVEEDLNKLKLSKADELPKGESQADRPSGDEGESLNEEHQWAELATDFLERYATQMTEYGLKVLKNEMKELSMVALYRNNHFLTVTLHQNEVFALVTDSAFYSHRCVWESLETYEYFDENFVKYVSSDRSYDAIGAPREKGKKSRFMSKLKRAFTRRR